MLYYCAYKWHSQTTQPQVTQRLVQQDAAGLHHQEKWKGWYQLAGGGAGFVLIDTDDPRELTAILQPYMDLVSWDVHAIYPLDYNTVLETGRQATQ
ncbi:MAG: DUF3303 domain-containing protein, partial [Dehalococcoidia bacterium]